MARTPRWRRRCARARTWRPSAPRSPTARSTRSPPTMRRITTTRRRSSSTSRRAARDGAGAAERLVKERPALLALADGTIFRGRAFGATGEAVGELVFNTSMTGYQEILTDPSYEGQLVAMTYPEIGNVGVNREDVESRRPYVGGFVVREYREAPSSWRAEESLGAYLARHGIPGIEGIDTRALLALRPDGVFLSNGPGDPDAVTGARETVAELLGEVPVFGICLGHQIMGLALGGRTYKLKFGHHGGNQPVQDLTTGKVEITAQNHGFAVDPDSLRARAEVTHLNLNDRTCEGLAEKGQPTFPIHYQTYTSPGPHDARYLFRRFTELMERTRR